MQKKVKAICDMAVLLYHVMEMEKLGVLTADHAQKISELIRLHYCT